MQWAIWLAAAAPVLAVTSVLGWAMALYHCRAASVYLRERELLIKHLEQRGYSVTLQYDRHVDSVSIASER